MKSSSPPSQLTTLSELIHIISLGAGVQSSTMSLMAAHGEITPMPNGAIFADTGYEPKAVYEWLDWLEARLPFPVYRVMAYENRRGIFQRDQTQIPAYKDTGGIGKRQCTSNWKVVPIERKLRELVNATGKRLMDIAVVSWIGISLDEVHRMKPNSAKWIRNRWPLIEKRINRHDCLRWMEQRNFPRPPRSACVFCPYKSDAEWRVTRSDPEAMAVVRNVEAMLLPGEYLHRSNRVIDDVDLSTDEDRGQMSLFGNECTGLCGV
jgi:hypothetical protein